MRPLKRTDYKSGILDVLRVLTTVGDISEEEWTERYDWMAKRGDEYYILVVCDGEGKIVGTGCVMVERKLYALGQKTVYWPDEVELISSSQHTQPWLSGPY